MAEVASEDKDILSTAIACTFNGSFSTTAVFPKISDRKGRPSHTESLLMGILTSRTFLCLVPCASWDWDKLQDYPDPALNKQLWKMNIVYLYTIGHHVKMP